MIHIMATVLFVILLVMQTIAVNYWTYWQKLADNNEKEAGLWKDVADKRRGHLDLANHKISQLTQQLTLSRDKADEALDEFRRAAGERDAARRQAKDLEFAQHQLKVVRDYLLGTSGTPIPPAPSTRLSRSQPGASDPWRPPRSPTMRPATARRGRRASGRVSAGTAGL